MVSALPVRPRNARTCLLSPALFAPDSACGVRDVCQRASESVQRYDGNGREGKGGECLVRTAGVRCGVCFHPSLEDRAGRALTRRKELAASKRRCACRNELLLSSTLVTAARLSTTQPPVTVHIRTQRWSVVGIGHEM
eukprot:3786956-Rhodomonas_salina.2